MKWDDARIVDVTDQHEIQSAWLMTPDETVRWWRRLQFYRRYRKQRANYRRRVKS